MRPTMESTTPPRSSLPSSPWGTACVTRTCPTTAPSTATSLSSSTMCHRSETLPACDLVSLLRAKSLFRRLYAHAWLTATCCEGSRSHHVRHASTLRAEPLPGYQGCGLQLRIIK